jgi:hypothetical protein
LWGPIMRETMVGQPTLQRLKVLEAAELRHMWRETRGSRPPTPLRRLLLRELAWRIQSEGSSGMDAETRRLLRAAVRSARIESSNPRRGAKKGARPRRRLSAPYGSVRPKKGLHADAAR